MSQIIAGHSIEKQSIRPVFHASNHIHIQPSAPGTFTQAQGSRIEPDLGALISIWPTRGNTQVTDSNTTNATTKLDRVILAYLRRSLAYKLASCNRTKPLSCDKYHCLQRLKGYPLVAQSCAGIRYITNINDMIHVDVRTCVGWLIDWASDKHPTHSI